MAKKSAKTSPALNAFMQQMKDFSLNEILFAVSEMNKEDQEGLAGFVSEQVSADIASHIKTLDMAHPCPDCGHEKPWTEGTRKGMPRYHCPKCGRWYTPTTGTLLEKTRYTWAAWVKATYCLLNGASLPETQKNLVDDLKCIEISENTVWKMRIKLMNAIAAIPSPTLTGVVKMDDTFFRENQKGTLELYNPIPDDMGIPREPRYGATPSKFGVMGNEFATASVMIDETGHMVVRMLGTGTIDDKLTEEFFKAHTDDVKFVCTDADRNLKKVFKRLGIPHYVKPSNYLKVLEKAGYEQASKNDEELAELQREHDNKVMSRLYNNGKIDHIYNFGKLSYNAFCDVKYANGLHLAEVNEIHKEMKEFIQKTREGGVSTRWLPLYLAFFEYVHNRKVDTGEAVVSMADAEQVLIAAIKTRTNITEDEIAEIRKQPIADVMASKQYMHALADKTETARTISGNAKFKFNDEDGVENFKVQEALFSMTIAQIKQIAKAVNLPGRASMKKTELVYALENFPGVEEAIITAAIGDVETRISDVDEKHDQYSHKVEGKNRNVLKNTFASRMYTHIDEMASTTADKVVVIDTETTGRNKQHDEILSVAAIDLEGTIKMEQLFRPRHCKRWKRAMDINHITPEMTIGKPRLAEKKADLEQILNDADVVVGWNLPFDLRMLYAGGVDMPMANEKYIDLMYDFARAYNSTQAGRGKAKYKLEEAASLLGLEYEAHTAKGDTSVLIPIWEWTRATLAAADAPKAA